MSEETTEPKVETKEPAPKEPKPQEELQALMSKLDEMGITNPEQLEKKARAASEAGRLANIVGTLRDEIAALKSQPATKPISEYDEGVDIDAAIGNAIDRALDKREQKQRQIQMQRMKEAQEIRSNEHYRFVAPKFEKYMGSPEAASRLANGETPKTIFNDFVISEYKNTMMATKKAWDAAQGDPSKTVVPHMESTQTPPPRIEPGDEQKRQLKTIKENWRGEDNDLSKALRALLPDEVLPV